MPHKEEQLLILIRSGLSVSGTGRAESYLTLVVSSTRAQSLDFWFSSHTAVKKGCGLQRADAGLGVIGGAMDAVFRDHTSTRECPEGEGEERREIIINCTWAVAIKLVGWGYRIILRLLEGKNKGEEGLVKHIT